MEVNSPYYRSKQRCDGGAKREAHVEITPSGRILRITIDENTTAADVKIWTELPCGVPCDVLGLEMDNRSLANDEVILKTAPQTDITLKLTLTSWWFKFVSACKKGNEEQVRARINIKMCGVSQNDRIFVAAFTAAQRGDHRLLFSVIAGRKVEPERKVVLSGRTLLHAAIFGGTISCMTNVLVNGGSSLLETPDMTGESPIQLARRLYGDGKILQLLNMYLELHRRETLADIWLLCSNDESSIISSGSPGDSQEHSLTEKDKDSAENSGSEGESYHNDNVCVSGKEEYLTGDSSHHLVEEDGSALSTSNRVAKPERVTLRQNQIDYESQDASGAESQTLEANIQDNGTRSARKPRVPNLKERRKLSLQKRNVRAPVIQARATPATITTTKTSATITSMSEVVPVTSYSDSTRLAVDWKEKQSDCPAVKTYGTPRQRRKGITIHVEQLPLVKLQLKHDLHTSHTNASSRDVTVRPLSSGDEPLGSTTETLPCRKAQSDRSVLLPALHANRTRNICNSSGRREGDIESQNGTVVKPPLPNAAGRRASPPAECSSVSGTR